MFHFQLDASEKTAMDARFSREGLSPTRLSAGEKLTHVWRWLGDAESNCLSLKSQIDKLYKQHDHDMKEVETYVEKVWLSASDRIKGLEYENDRIRRQVMVGNVGPSCCCPVTNGNDSPLNDEESNCEDDHHNHQNLLM